MKVANPAIADRFHIEGKTAGADIMPACAAITRILGNIADSRREYRLNEWSDDDNWSSVGAGCQLRLKAVKWPPHAVVSLQGSVQKEINDG